MSRGVRLVPGRDSLLFDSRKRPLNLGILGARLRKFNCIWFIVMSSPLENDVRNIERRHAFFFFFFEKNKLEKSVDKKKQSSVVSSITLV